VYMQPNMSRQDFERGQASVAAAGVLAVVALFVVALSLIGQAMVDRSRAQSAADAIALASASATDPDRQRAADDLVDWYESRGIEVRQQGAGQTMVISGPSRADARAGVAQTTTQRTPALVALLARAEQLVGQEITPISWHEFAIALTPEHGQVFVTVATDLGLCEVSAPIATPGSRTFELC